MIEKIISSSLSFVKKWIAPFLISCILFLLLKFFFFDFKIIEKTSMEGTLKEGDIVLLKKVNHFFRLDNTINHNDVVIFDEPSYGKNINHLKFIKRCIGLPGDSIQSIDNRIYISNEPLKNPKNLKLIFKAEFSNDDSVLYQLNENGIKSALKTDKEKEWIFNATREKALKIAGKLNVEKFEEINLMGPTTKPFFLSNLYPNWNIDSYGPIYIPKKGDSIKLNLENISIYGDLIAKMEENVISVRNDTILINDSYNKYYEFKQNYYFVIGDNRYNSYDSRFFGFLPEENIIGTVSHIICSYDAKTKSFRNKRFIQSLYE